MKNRAYRKAILNHGPSRQQKAEIWARLEAASRAEESPVYGRCPEQTQSAFGTRAQKGAKSMNTLYSAQSVKTVYPRRDRKAQTKRQRKLAAIAAALILVLCGGLFLTLMRERGQSMLPFPRSGSELPAANGGSRLSQETKEELPQLILSSRTLRQLRQPAFPGDPLLMENEIKDASDIPSEMPVYQLSMPLMEEEATAALLRQSLEHAARSLNLSLNMKTLTKEKSEQSVLGFADYSVETEDGSLILLARLLHHTGLVLDVFPTDLSAYTATWPTGYTYMNEEALSSDLTRVYSDDPQRLENIRSLNRDEEQRPQALQAFVQSSLEESQAVISQWQKLLPWSGEEQCLGEIFRSNGRAPIDYLSCRLTASFPLRAEAYPDIQGEPTGAYAEKLWNSFYRRVNWLLSSDLTSGEGDEILLGWDKLAIPQRLQNMYRERFSFPEASDPWQHSHSSVIGFRLVDFSCLCQQLGQYPLKSLEEAREAAKQLLDVNFEGEPELLAEGMSYRAEALVGSQGSYLLPAYDFVFQGKERPLDPAIATTVPYPSDTGGNFSTREESGVEETRIFISVPAIRKDYLAYPGNYVSGYREIVNEKGEVITTGRLDQPTEVMSAVASSAAASPESGPSDQGTQDRDTELLQMDIAQLEPQSFCCTGALDLKQGEVYRLRLKHPENQEVFVALHAEAELKTSPERWQQYQMAMEGSEAELFFVGDKSEHLYVYVGNLSSEKLVNISGKLQKIDEKAIETLFLDPQKLAASTLSDEDKLYQDERGGFELQCASHNAAEDVVVYDNLYQIRGDWDKHLALIGENATAMQISSSNMKKQGRKIDMIRILDMKTVAIEDSSNGYWQALIRDALINKYEEYVLVRVQVEYEGMPLGSQVPDGKHTRHYLLGRDQGDSDWKICEFYWYLQDNNDEMESSPTPPAP